MNGKANWISIVLSLVAIVAVGTFYITQKKSSQHPFVQVKKVFDDFEMSKEYKKKLDGVTLARKGIIDSLEMTLTAESKAIKATQGKAKDKVDQFVFDKEYYMEKRKQFDEDNEALQKQYNEEIVKQMNQYIKDYGEKKGFEYILGADGSGALMFANDNLDITNEVIKYINERYKGSPK